MEYDLGEPPSDRIEHVGPCPSTPQESLASASSAAVFKRFASLSIVFFSA